MIDRTRSRLGSPSARHRLGVTVLFAAAAVTAVTGCSASGVPLVADITATAHDVGDRSDGSDAADGVLPEGTSVSDDDLPGISGLDAGLLSALRAAAADALHDDVRFSVTSGWRSPDYQNRLLDEAVDEYGSREEAARWVATAETSAHVTGDAVDIGPFDATYWLSQNGASYGLCQTYANESWHFELRPEAVSQGCPTPYVDPTHDPRMQP